MFGKKIWNRWETLISVVMGVFILAIISVTIANMLGTNYTLEDDYNRNNAIFLLQNNATNILRKVDTSSVSEGEIFYLYKDPNVQIFKILTGTTNEPYKYINKYSDLVTNTGSNPGIVYTQIFFAEKKESSAWKGNQIIKASIRELMRK